MSITRLLQEPDINEKVANLMKKTPFIAISLIIHLTILVVLMSIKFSVEIEAKTKNIVELKTPVDEQSEEEENSILKEISEEEIEKGEMEKFETHPELFKMDINQLDSGKIEEKSSFSSQISREVPIPCVNVACKESDHNESANEDYIHNTIKGDGLIYGGRMPVRGSGSQIGQGGRGGGEGILDVIGLGGGSGGYSPGMFGYRFGGKENLIARAGGDPTKVDSLIVKALKWLARHQHKDGYWDGVQFDSHCDPNRVCPDKASSNEHDVGLTGLALLAFLGYGITPQVTINNANWKNEDMEKYVYHDKYVNKQINVTEVVRKGLLWLKNNQLDNGCFVKNYKLMRFYMYDHIIATLAMAEACGITGNRVWCDSAKEGAGFLISGKTNYGGWRYTWQHKDSDISVTGWAMMALKSAQGSGRISISKEILTNVLNWMDKRMVLSDDTYRVMYDENGGITSCLSSGENCNYGGELSMTAVGMLIRMLADPEGSMKGEGYKILKKQAEQLIGDLPTVDIVRKDGKNPRDYYYWYYGTLALYLLDGPEGFSNSSLGYWKIWNKEIMNTLIKLQEGDAKLCSFGSFPAKNDKWGMIAGRVYATAINALTMEVYFRYKNVFKSMLEGVIKADEKKTRDKK
ncbi:MAG: prenyltransferase/squalene oxidase repeat-containing protein [Planctomycetota bacterium]